MDKFCDVWLIYRDPQRLRLPNAKLYQGTMQEIELEIKEYICKNKYEVIDITVSILKDEREETE